MKDNERKSEKITTKTENFRFSRKSIAKPKKQEVSKYKYVSHKKDSDLRNYAKKKKNNNNISYILLSLSDSLVF